MLRMFQRKDFVPRTYTVNFDGDGFLLACRKDEFISRTPTTAFQEVVEGTYLLRIAKNASEKQIGQFKQELKGLKHEAEILDAYNAFQNAQIYRPT